MEWIGHFASGSQSEYFCFGWVTANITIPTSFGSGIGQIEVSTSPKNTVLTSFTVSNPVLTLTPITGLPGSEVTVAGTNFSGNQIVTIKWDDQIIRSAPTSVMTTPLGSFFATIIVPPTSRGVHTVSASAGNNTINLPQLLQ